MRPTGRPYRRARAATLAASNICWICGKPGADTVDHVVPRSLGGAVADRSNLRPAHYSCNSARGNGTRTHRRGTPERKNPTSRAW